MLNQCLVYQQQQVQQPKFLQEQQLLEQHQLLHPQQQQRQPPLQQHQPSYPKLSRLEEQASLTEEVALVRETKVICSLDTLLDLFNTCHHPSCGQPLMRPTVIINWTCPYSHKGKFSSSKEINEMPIIFKLLLRIFSLGTISLKLKGCAISLVCHLSQSLHSTECSGCISSPVSTNGGTGRQTSHLKSSKVWKWKWWSVVMASVTRQDTQLKTCAIF